jgi:hypothetical protein
MQKEKGVVSRMKQRHNPDARAYHEYYLNQAGRGYPVYVGTRYRASPTILGSTRGQYTYREFTPLVTSATYGAL